MRRDPEIKLSEAPLVLLGLGVMIVGVWAVLMIVGLMVLSSKVLVEALF